MLNLCRKIPKIVLIIGITWVICLFFVVIYSNIKAPISNTTEVCVNSDTTVLCTFESSTEEHHEDINEVEKIEDELSMISVEPLYSPVEVSYSDIGLSHEEQDLVREMIQMYNFDVDEYFFYAMMYNESRFNPDAYNDSGASGLLQIMPATWDSIYYMFCEEYPDYYVENNVFNPKSNIIIGMYYIKYIRDFYGFTSVAENYEQILLSYACGPGGAQSYYETYGTYTSSYVKTIERASTYIRENHSWKEGM